MSPEMAKMYNFSNMNTDRIYDALKDLPREVVNDLMVYHSYGYDTEITANENVRLFAEHITQSLFEKSKAENMGRTLKDAVEAVNKMNGSSTTLTRH